MLPQSILSICFSLQHPHFLKMIKPFQQGYDLFFTDMYIADFFNPVYSFLKNSNRRETEYFCFSGFRSISAINDRILETIFLLRPCRRDLGFFKRNRKYSPIHKEAINVSGEGCFKPFQNLIRKASTSSSITSVSSFI